MAKRHAKIGPSSFEAREICPSYSTTEEDTAASRRGDRLHGLIEEFGHKAIESPKFAELTERDQYQVEQICCYIKPYELREGVQIFREYEFDLSPLEIQGCDLGTGDLLIVDESSRVADLFDCKFGWWSVTDVEENIQQWIYVLGVFLKFEAVDTVNAHILQPGRDEVSTHTFTRDDIPRMLLRARTISERVFSKNKVYNPVHDNCLFCDAKAECPALHQLALKAQNLSKLDLPANLAELDCPEKFGPVYEAMDILVKWAKAVKDKIVQQVADGKNIPGYHLVTKNGRRSIIDVALAKEILSKRWSVSDQEFLTLIEISISQLEELIRKKAVRGEKEKHAAEVMTSLVDEGIIVSSAAINYLAKD